MTSFIWDSSFLTGIDDVDDQHFYLVGLINKLGDLLVHNEVSEEKVGKIFQDLYHYTHYHFKEEELLMKNAGIHPLSLSEHIDVHKEFLSKVSAIHDEILVTNPASLKVLLDFLINWLVYHILGMDKSMAAQLKAIEDGCTAEEAFEMANSEVHNATEALLSALNNLFRQVSDRNKELYQLNKTLEMKVIQRTEALQEANQHLEALAITDALTNLPNRRYAMLHLSKLWKLAQLNNKPLACLMVDADNFKEINDKYGHDAGDNVLVELSLLLQGLVHNDDIVCRLGGDEFLILCENTDYAGAKHLAQVLCEQVAMFEVETGEGCWLGSVSIGVGSKQEQMQDFDELIKMADQGLYLAKEAGKGCAKCIN